MGTINACKVCGISEGNCLCLDAIKAGYPSPQAQQQPEVRSGEWVEELTTALRHIRAAIMLCGKQENDLTPSRKMWKIKEDMLDVWRTHRSSSTGAHRSLEESYERMGT